MLDPEKKLFLESISKKIRKKCIEIANSKNPNATHLGGALSSIDILVTLYYEIMKYDVNKPDWELRDRFFLSKGHSILGYYSILSDLGYFSDEVLYSYGQNLTKLPGHPVRNKSLGIEFEFSGSVYPYGPYIGFPSYAHPIILDTEDSVSLNEFLNF